MSVCPAITSGCRVRVSVCPCVQLRYREEKEKPDAARVVLTAENRTSVLIGHLGGSSTYLLSLRAYNSAGFGPPSAVINVTTKKPRELGAPGSRSGRVMGRRGEGAFLLMYFYYFFGS